MKWSFLLGSSALLALGASAASASILGLADNGKVYAIDTATAAATEYATLLDLSGQDPNTPNALGTSGTSLFYTAFYDGGTTRELYRDSTKLTDIPVGGGFTLATGDAVGDTYYYADRTGNFGTVTNINATPGSQTATLQDIGGYSGDTVGDIAVRGNDVFISYGSSLSRFALNDPAGGFLQTVAQGTRYAGLAFDGNLLFGIVTSGFQNSGTNKLYSIDPTTLAASLIGSITGLPTASLQINDAAPTVVPLPAAAWLFISALTGIVVVGRRRRIHDIAA